MLQRVLAICHQFECLDTFAALNLSNDLHDKIKCERSSKFRCDLLTIDYSKSTTAIEKYSHRSKEWIRLDNVPIGVFYFGAEMVEEKLIINGGCNNGPALSMVSIQIY